MAFWTGVCPSSARSFTACSRPTPWRLAPLFARPWPSSPQLFPHAWRTATRCWPTGRAKSSWRRDTLSRSWSTYCISSCSTSGWAGGKKKNKVHTRKGGEKTVQKWILCRLFVETMDSFKGLSNSLFGILRKKMETHLISMALRC